MQAQAEQNVLNHQSKSPAKKDILIVDDTPENLRLLSRLLSGHGYNIRKASSGAMALQAIHALLPDLILLDIMMPEMDGYEVCKKLKEVPETADIPIIFLSALHDINDKVQAFKAGGIDYITKPFRIEEVLVRVESQLALREAEKAIKEMNVKLEEMVKERTKELEIANAKLLKMALYDNLTGLPNRALLMQRLQTLLNRVKADANYQFAVFFLDCDRFKLINDSLGHSVGDELLSNIGRRLQQHIGENDTLARLGGDEFAILMTRGKQPETSLRLAHQIIEALTYPFQLSRHEVFINASIGIAIGDNSYEQPEYILRDADTAMYRAKSTGKGRYHIFDPEMHSASLNTLQLENDLRRALEKQELVLNYQPIVNLQTGKISGLEALVRWQHSRRGLIRPDAFIPLAEETGLITSIGDWVLKQACSDLKHWQNLGLVGSDFTMSVNLSARQFAQPNLIAKIDKTVQDTEVDYHLLKLEITETAIMDNAELASQLLQKLKDRKIQLCIDDFGTGYSSLSYLHSFPVDVLKVDKSFVQKLDNNPANLGLVPAILSIAKTMDMRAIAEGIETPEQLHLLRDLQCQYGQGYLFAKPLSAKDIIDLIQSNPSW